VIDGEIDFDALAEAREQLWAEAHARYVAGEKWHMTDPALVKAAKEIQADKFQPDPWEAPIRRWLREMSDAGKKRRSRGVTTFDVMVGALKIHEHKMQRADEMRVAAVLKRLDWQQLATWAARAPGDRSRAPVSTRRGTRGRRRAGGDVGPVGPGWTAEVP
jgi:predicted P-loop ATPase